MAVHDRYNGFKYNEGRYNVNDLILYFTEAMSAAETRANALIRNLVDAILSADSMTKSIANKVLTETLRLYDWLSMKKNPPADPWNDQ